MLISEIGNSSFRLVNCIHGVKKKIGIFLIKNFTGDETSGSFLPFCLPLHQSFETTV